MSHQHGFVRLSAATPVVSVADPTANVDTMLSMLRGLPETDIALFPELSVSAYTCGQLFHQRALLDECESQTKRLCEQSPNPKQVVIVGAPIKVGTALYNCAVVLHAGKVLGIVPKQFLPNYNEFYEARYFASGHDELPETIEYAGQTVPFGTRLLFSSIVGTEEVVLSIEICEAIWMPIPPSSLASVAGANVICNLSTSPETVGKAGYRRNLVTSQSGRCIAAYAYAGSGPTESTADLVFGGHSLIAEGGHLIAESTRVGDTATTNRGSYSITSDIDIERLQTERRTTTTFPDNDRFVDPGQYRRIAFELSDQGQEHLLFPVPAMPFVPKAEGALAERCADVFGIQTCALAKRLEILGREPKSVIGISGGLDSTLSLLVAVKTYDLLGLPRSLIRGVTMPGFGTTDHTLTNARNLMTQLGVTQTEIDIRRACLDEFKELAVATGYKPFGLIDLIDDESLQKKNQYDISLKAFTKAMHAVPEDKQQDLTFENVQARRRTELLMNMGFVLGTGDMSEMWLGWCTYNADQQSMYNVNASVPKTLVKFLVRYVAEHQFDGDTRDTLFSVAATEISPELLPTGKNGEARQSTEDSVGPYELHDFFMFNLVRYGFSPAKVLFLAKHATGWSTDYSHDEIKHWLSVNLRRAFSQQYKRDNVPNGPKVGSISLSPRGDWRMPSDASVAAWIRTLN